MSRPVLCLSWREAMWTATRLAVLSGRRQRVEQSVVDVRLWWVRESFARPAELAPEWLALS